MPGVKIPSHMRRSTVGTWWYSSRDASPESFFSGQRWWSLFRTRWQLRRANTTLSQGEQDARGEAAPPVNDTEPPSRFLADAPGSSMPSADDAAADDDDDAATAILLPGMSRLTIAEYRSLHSPRAWPPPNEEADALSPTGHCSSLPPSAPGKISRRFVERASKTPDLLTTLLPPEVLFVVFERLDLADLLALRRTCRTLRNAVPMPVLEKALRVQNHAGWRVVFEVNGTRYPGTTYGNKRLCGRCVVPKTRAHLVEGKDVRAYLLKRGFGKAEGEGKLYDEDTPWPERWGMCFPCLWALLAFAPAASDSGTASPVSDASTVVAIYAAPGTKQADSPASTATTTTVDGTQDLAETKKEPWELAGISPKEVFNMLDGSQRKICGGCRRDIHENAVPCPHCVDFGQWLIDRRKK